MKPSEPSVGKPGDGQPLLTRPAVDAWIIALVVLGSFFLSAAIVLWRGKAEARSLDPHLAGSETPHMVCTGGHLSGLLPDDWINLAPVAAIAVAVAALLGFLAYTASRRFHNAYAQLARAEKRLRDVADAAGEYIWEVDGNGHYTFLSERVWDVLGYTPAELLGRHPFEFVDREESAGVRSHSDFLVQRAHAFRDFEHRMLRKDGQWIWLSVNGVPVLDPQGRLVGFRGAALDITDRKQYEQDLVREKEAAQAASVAKSQFLATMSHEIPQRENLETIRTSATGLMALLNDILEFSRTEAGPVNKPQPTRIRDFLGQVASLHMPVARGKGIDLRVEVETAVPEWLQLDQACLRQIVINLVGNAVKFTDHGFVRVSVSDDPEVAGNGGFPLRIAVTDTGVGILQETRQHLFEPFSQGDSSPTRKFGGTGLGLAVCRKLAGLVGCSVRLQDSSPHGSTFVLTGRFDVAGPPESPAPAATGTSKAAATPLPLRVLVAEDNPASRKLMQIMLSKEGIAHETAVDGEEVLAKHTRQAFDLILMDIRMPVMDGISATRAIRGEEAAGRLPGRVAIVALTADAMDGNRESCLRVGMDDCLNKPVNRETLAAVLAKHRRS